MSVTIEILEDDDVIRADDWVRQLTHMYTGDEVFFNSEYGGKPINRMTWTPAHIISKRWIGRTIREEKEYMGRMYLPMEFARGPVPVAHRTDMSKEPID